jgi:Pyruvate/2-oxoacid:ferredoxin oxidoreductase delta subunit
MQRKPRLGLVRPSTRAFTREARRLPGFSRFDWLHGYVYARWPYLYIGTATGEHTLARVFGPPFRLWKRLFPPRSHDGQEPITWADTYHGKVMPFEAASQLVTIEEDLTLTDLEQAIPFALARDIILKNPDRIVALECPCRASRSSPCQPLDVCLVVGEPFASFVIEHHPRRSRWIAQQEAVEILRAERDRGHVSHAYFKDAMLGRFYAICNCCSCCCGAMQAHQRGTPMIISSGYVAQPTVELCAGCGECADFCQFEAIAVRNGHATVDGAACMGCGVCVAKCPQTALELRREPSRGEPLEIRALMAEAAHHTETAGL